MGVVNYEVIGGLSISNGVPVPNVTVWIFDYETGASSTVAVTSAHAETQGQFRCTFTTRRSRFHLYWCRLHGHGSAFGAFQISADTLETMACRTYRLRLHRGRLAIPALAAPFTFGTNVSERHRPERVRQLSARAWFFRSVVGGGYARRWRHCGGRNHQCQRGCDLGTRPGKLRNEPHLRGHGPRRNGFPVCSRPQNHGSWDRIRATAKASSWRVRIRVVGTVLSPMAKNCPRSLGRPRRQPHRSGLPNEAWSGHPINPPHKPIHAGHSH